MTKDRAHSKRLTQRRVSAGPSGCKRFGRGYALGNHLEALALGLCVIIVLAVVFKGNYLGLVTPVAVWVTVASLPRRSAGDARGRGRSTRRHGDKCGNGVQKASHWRVWAGLSVLALTTPSVWRRVTAKSAAPEDATIAQAIRDAERLCEHGRLQEAAYAFQAIRVPEHLPRRNAQKYHNLGVIHVQLGHVEKAVEALEKAIQYDPADVQAYAVLGRLAYDKGDYNRAEEYYGRAVELAPEREDLRRVLRTVNLRLSTSGP